MVTKDMQFRHALGSCVCMLKNYLKTAFRNLRKSKGHSIINMAGLSIGMAVALLIGIWIWDELAFNKSIPRYDRIAQLWQNANNNGEKVSGSTMPIPLSAELRAHYGSNFKHVVMSSWSGGHMIAIGTKVVTREGAYMEPDAPELFSLNMIRGTRQGIKDGNTVLLSKSAATAIFGDKDPMGSVIRVDNKIDLKVTGEYEDLPANSSFNNLGFIGSWPAYLAAEPWTQHMDDAWGNNSWQVYAEIAPNTTMASVSAAIRLAKYKNCSPDSKKYNPELFLHPMSRWYLYGEFRNGVNTGGRIQYVWLFGIIGVFVLLLACINFMNLSTARSEKRAKEVGIRKAIGSMRSQLISQFFTESLLMAFIAFAFSLVLVSISLSSFNVLAQKQMIMPWSNPVFWMAGLGFCLLTGLIAGSYPALYLSSFQPVKVLKGTFRAGRLAALPRQVLVVLQFTVSVSLIIGTIVVFRQVEYAKDRPIGYNQDGLVSVNMITNEIPKHFDAVRTELKNAGVIDEMTASSSPVTGVWGTNGGFEWAGKDPSQAVEFPTTGVSAEYGHTVGWQFVAGRDFNKDLLTDSTTFVLNESAARFIGLKDPIGKIIKWDGTPFRIIGIIKDMLMESPYAPVRPSIYSIYKDHSDVVILKLNRKLSPTAALNKVKQVFTKYSPTQPFSFTFVDDQYAHKFGDEQRTGKLAGIFAMLAVFISCLGLFGMASYMAEQRTKEIGVRKVLGAGVFNLWRLLSKDFVVLVGISLLIGMPLAWYGMHRWLEGYEYRSGIAWWIFVLTGIAALAITLLTVSIQAIRAALANPIKSLRTE